MSSNRQVVERYFASPGTEYARVLADDVELIEWADGVPTTGARTHGKAAFLENRGRREYRLEIARLTEEGDVVVAEGIARGASKDGEPWTVRFCNIFELENGLVKRLTTFGVSVKGPT
ncbi:MAG TPA: nuclear transport factor 2 family protein [Thermoplasmata archaeon]|nr:nuclear transport factor 2 family protein [Thermoplasmata archaeon]